MSLNEVIRQVDVGEIIRDYYNKRFQALKQEHERLQQDYTALEEEVNKKDLGLKQVSVEINRIEATLRDLESKIRVYGKEAKHKELASIRATHADLQKRVSGLKEKLKQSQGPYTNRTLKWVVGAGIAAVLFAGVYFLKDVIGDYGQRKQDVAQVVVEGKQEPAQEFQQSYAPAPPKTSAPQQQTARDISDVVEKEEPSALGPKVEEKARKTTTKAKKESKILVLDILPADGGNKKTQDQWFDYWSNVNDGRVMASMGDFYAVFKDIKRMREHGTKEEKAKANNLLASLRDDFDRTSEISSTRIFYQPNSIDSKIVQHYRCNQPEKVKKTKLKIPEYLGVPIAQVIADSKGLNYIQTLFDTEDDAETIIQTLEFISNKKRNDIYIHTPPLKTKIMFRVRAESPEKAVSLVYSDGDFHVLGNLLYIGRSRGVLVNPR